MTKMTAAMALAATSMLFAAPARAADFALTCVGTETGYTIHFQYRWGKDDDWKRVSVAPGKWQLLRYTYAEPGRHYSPQLQIRYDDDLSDGERYVITPLETYAATRENCEKQGRTFNFEEDGSELVVVSGD